MVMSDDGVPEKKKRQKRDKQKGGKDGTVFEVKKAAGGIIPIVIEVGYRERLKETERKKRRADKSKSLI